MPPALGSLPGQSAFESATGNAIVTTCQQLVALGGNIAPGSASDDLKTQCGNMAQQGAFLTGAGGANTLAMDVSQTNDAIVQLSSTQTSAQGIQSIEGSRNNIDALTARMLDVRAGARGVSMKGFGDGELYAFKKAFGGEEDRWLASLWEDAAAGASEDDGEPGRFGVFVNGIVNFGDSNPTQTQAGYKYNVYGITAGADYMVNDFITAGLAFNWRQDDTRFNNAQYTSLGKLEDFQLGGSAYVSIFQDGFYADFIGAYIRHDFDNTRRIVYGSGANAVDRTAKSSTFGNEWSWAFGTGWDFPIEQVPGLTVGPLGRLEWARLTIDSYDESGAFGLNLHVNDQLVKSFSTVIGGKITYAISTPVMVLVPEFRADWQYEFQNDPRQITLFYLNDPLATQLPLVTSTPSRSWANIGAALAATMPWGVSGFIDWTGMFGRDGYTNNLFTFGVRAQF